MPSWEAQPTTSVAWSSLQHFIASTTPARAAIAHHVTQSARSALRSAAISVAKAANEYLSQSDDSFNENADPYTTIPQHLDPRVLYEPCDEQNCGLGFVTPIAPSMGTVQAITSGISDRGMSTHNQPPRAQPGLYAPTYGVHPQPRYEPARPQPAPARRQSWIPPAPPPQLIQSPPPGLHPARDHGPIPNQRPVVIHASHQQTGRYCAFNGGKGRAGARDKDMNVRDFIISFQIVADAQGGTWTQAQMIAECKNRCNHKLDKQLALLAAYEPFGWETWKNAFINHFRDSDDDFHTLNALLNIKARPGQTISDFNAYFNQVICEAEQICEQPLPDALLKHLYLNGIPADLRRLVAPVIQPHFTVHDCHHTCATTAFHAAAVPSPPEPTPQVIDMAPFNAIVKDATKRVVENIRHPPAPAAEPSAIELQPL